MGIFGAKFDPAKDIPNMKGKVAIVTGANAGIGLYTVLHLARLGATVHLCARSQSKFDAALERLEKEDLGPNYKQGSIKWLQLNLTDPRDAKAAAMKFVREEKRLDVLINNAGKIISEFGLTADGISDSVMINHISPFVFTQTLLPLMVKTQEAGGDVRIINLSSYTHRWVSNPRYNSLEALNNDFTDTWNPKTKVYSYTKLANVLYTRELQRRLDAQGKGIIVMAVHPGSVLSDGNVNLFSSLPMGRFLVFLASLFFITSSEGAYTSAFAAFHPDVRRKAKTFKGNYVVPGNYVEKTSSDAEDPKLAVELWETTERVLKGLGVEVPAMA